MIQNGHFQKIRKAKGTLYFSFLHIKKLSEYILTTFCNRSVTKTKTLQCCIFIDSAPVCY